MNRSDPVNRTIRVTTTVLGITLAIAGFHHGLFEALQGRGPTPGLGIHSIGPEHVRWEYGTDDAITILPDFLLTGVAAMGVSLAIVASSLFGLTRRHGVSVFLGLFVLLTLVGGGIGHIPFFLAVWAYATRLRGPLPWWRRHLRGGAGGVLARVWPYALFLSSVSFVVALELSVFGFPPMQHDPDGLLLAIWAILLASFALLHVSYVGAIARDLGEAS